MTAIVVRGDARRLPPQDGGEHYEGWRTHDPGERARALHVDKPPPVLAGQLDMWEGAL